MRKAKCKRCGKVIEGYSKQHADYLLLQHNLTHRKKEDSELKNGDS